MAELIRHFKWSFISVVHSADQYGINAEKSLRSLLSEIDVCISQSIELTDSMDYGEVIEKLRSHRNARVVILYADIKHIQPLMTAVRDKKAYQEFIWAGSDTTSVKTNMENENCKHLLGSLSVTFFHKAPPDFYSYLKMFSKEYESYLDNLETFNEATKELKKNQEPSTDNRSMFNWNASFSKDRWMYTIPYAIDAVYAFAYALQRFIQDNCPEAIGADVKSCLRGGSLLPYLKSIRFNSSSGDSVCFNNNGDALGNVAIMQCQMDQGNATSKRIGSWNTNSELLIFDKEPRWPNNANTVPISVCGDPCRAGSIYTFPRQTCCWTCVACKINEITVNKTTRCSECPDLEWPEEGKRQHCLLIQPTIVKVQDILPLILAFVAVLGLMMSTITAFTFFTFRHERVIRSSSKELSFFMLIGIVTAFLLVFSLLVPPTGLTCYISHVGFSLTFTLVYSPLLVKTNRIYRIFKAGRRTAALPMWTSSTSQLCIALLFILIQVMIVTFSSTINPPTLRLSMPIKTEKYVSKFCDMPLTGFLASLAYNLVLVLICTWYAFKTRRLPDNYNESRYIAFCVDTTVLIWISFIPTYFTVTRTYFKVIILALALLINSIVCLLCLFVPKLYTLYLSRRSSTSRSIEERSELNIQMVSNTSFTGFVRSGNQYSSYKEKDGSFGLSQNNCSSKYTSDSMKRQNGGASCQEVQLLKLPEDVVASPPPTNGCISISEHSDSIS